MSARSACPRPKSIASSKHCSPANSRRSRSASRCACSTRRRLARRRRALPWSRIGPKRSPSPTRATCTTAFGRRGSSPGRRSRSSSGASGAGAERHSGHARGLSARRQADQLHRRQGGAGDRPPRARLQEPRRHQRLSHPGLEVRDSRRAVRHREGRDPRAVLLAVGGRRAASLAARRARWGRGPRPHVLAVRELQGWERRRDGRGDVSGTRPRRRVARDSGVGALPLADGLRIAQFDRRRADGTGVDLPLAAGFAVHVLGKRRTGRIDHFRPPSEHQPPRRGDRESVPDPTDRPMKVAVVGGGAWGTALADLLARKGEQVTIWAREAEVVDSVNRRHVNEMFLPGASLAPALTAEGDLAAAIRGAETIVSAAPSHAVRPVMAEAAQALDRSRPLIVSASKGLDPDRLERPSCVPAAVLPAAAPVAVLSGPSFAWEVFQQQPTAVVAAATDHGVAQRTQRVFSTNYFRVYSHTDVVGVELAGALKNVIALAPGILEGLGLGFNTRAALIQRGLAGITRLGVTLGAQATTFAGLAGMGDLILTSTGALSRNRTLGVALGQGQTLEQALAGKPAVVEGVNTTRTAVALGERHGVDLPIAREVANVLFKNKPPRQAVSDLMERELKAEGEGRDR